MAGFVLPREPSTQESLQCLASAGLQEIGESFSEEDLLTLMKGEHEKQELIKLRCGIDWSVMERRFKEWSTNPSNPADLKRWTYSSLTVAKSLRDSTYLQGNYTFYRQDRFPTSGRYTSFKDMFDVLKNEIKAKVKNDSKFAKGVAGKVLGQLSLNSDKWNPADIVAVRVGKEREWDNKINNFLARSKPGIKLAEDLTSFIKGLKKQRVTSNKLDIIPAMKDLYEYNKMIYEGIEKNNFIPISLKLSEIPNPNTKLTKISEPKDLEKYFGMTVKISDFQMKAGDQKAIIFFEVDGLPGKTGKYSVDIRGFEPTRKIADIQIGLLKEGGSTYQGKITLPVTTMITKLSNGRMALSKMNAEKRRRFKKMDNRMRNKLKSNIHGFVDYKAFSEYYARNAQKLEEDVNEWGDYVQFLSNGRTKSLDFVESVVGDIARSKKANEYNLTKSFTRAKYMKNKLQSFEVAYIMDSSPLKKEIKNNILKSMWLYAASEGFTVFNKNESTTFLLSSSYIKCAA